MAAQPPAEDLNPNLAAVKVAVLEECYGRLEIDLEAPDVTAIEAAVDKALTRGFRLGEQAAADACGRQVLEEWDELARRRSELTQVLFPIAPPDSEVDRWAELYGPAAG